MPELAPNPQLLRSLGKLARGLSALFWGLPAALLIAAETLSADLLKPLGVVPLLAVNLLLLYGLWQVGQFQRQERPWRLALDRTMLLAVVDLGLSPFVYFHNRMPREILFSYAVLLLELSAVVFLFNLNLLLKRLGAMLPDETLRQETRQFTALNRWLLVLLLFYFGGFVWITGIPYLILPVIKVGSWTAWLTGLVFISIILLPLAVTMALIWKTKEVILEAVFGPRH